MTNRQSMLRRLAFLEAAVAPVTAAGELPGGPAHRIAADYAKGGKKKDGAKRHVASKAGEKRYGLPIGTPLGQTKSKGKNDPATQRSYETFMAADTPANQRKNATWMSTDELSRTAEALFSFQSSNERDESARIVLIRELADRGIDPHTLGYRGGPVVINPNPKEDPSAKRIRLDQSKAESAAKKAKAAAEAAARQKLRDQAAKQLTDYAPTDLVRRKTG